MRIAIHLRSVLLLLSAVSIPAYASSGGLTFGWLHGVLLGLLGIALIAVAIGRWQINKLRKVGDQADEILQHWQKMLHRGAQPTLQLDQNLHVSYANQAAARLFQIKVEQLQGLPLTQLLAFDDQPALQQALTERQAYHQQLAQPQLDKHLYLVVTPLKDALDTLQLGLQDVSPWVNTELQLEADLAFSHQHTALATVGQVSFDLASGEWQLDDSLANWLGSDVPAQGKLTEWQQLLGRDDWRNWSYAYEQVHQGQPLSMRCYLQAGEQRHWVSLNGLVREQDEQRTLYVQVVDQAQEAEIKTQYETIKSQFMTMINGIDHAVYAIDEQQRIVACNSRFAMIQGMLTERVVGVLLSELPVWNDKLSERHQQDDLMMMASTGQQELTLQQANQPDLDIGVSVKPVKLPDGKNIGQIGIWQDLTERNANRQAVAQSQQQIEQLMESAPLPLAVIDGEDNIVSSNLLFAERLGQSRDSLAGQSFYGLFSEPVSAGKAGKILQQQGELHGFQADLTSSAGEHLIGELDIAPYDEQQQLKLCWIRDISAQQFEQDKFDSLLQHSSMPMAVLEEQGFVQVNPAAEQFFGASQQQPLLGQLPWAADYNSNEQAQQRLQDVIEQVRQDGQAQSLVWQHQRGDEVLPCQATYVPMYKGQQLESILCIWMDMRAVKKADEARLQAINLKQAAELQMAEQQQLLETSQHQLASKLKSLQQAENKLQQVEEDLSHQQSHMSDLQQAHQDVVDNLKQVQQDYAQSRKLLADSEQHNSQLQQQLKQAGDKVGALEKQRNGIADALQQSEKQYQRARQQLSDSEQTRVALQKQQQQQQQQLTENAAQIEQLKDSIAGKDKQLSDVSGQINQLQSQLLSSAQSSEKLRQKLLNQRKASEHAEQQRRELEQACQQAQNELAGKASFIDHLQTEMHKFEQLSQQQQGDLAEQQKLLQQELQEKQQQLQTTQQQLDAARQQAEQANDERQQQQQQLSRLQQELQDVQRRSEQQQQEVTEADQYWQQQQQQLQAALEEKQQELAATRKILDESKQQTEAEKAAKAEQQQKFDQLQQELADMQQRQQEQQRQIDESDQQWQQRQQALQQELEAKLAQLQQTEQQLQSTTEQSEQERQASQAQQQKLEQLKMELASVEQRSEIQRDLMAGNDEQWRKQHEEIAAQKQQLQQQLEQAQQQNVDMQAKLKESLAQLDQAENQVSHTQSGEQQLQKQLEEARQQAQQLKQQLQQREQQESSLQQQLSEQQQVLQGSEQNISQLQSEQQKLTEQLASVQQQYNKTQTSLSEKDADQQQLAEQLAALEQQLQDSKSQLESKETALQDAQSRLQQSQAKLSEQEQTLLKAHKQAMQNEQQDEPQPQRPAPSYASLPMPADPDTWFSLLGYLQQKGSEQSLTAALNELLDQLEQLTERTDKAVEEENAGQILVNARKLVKLAGQLGSEPLMDMSMQLEAAGKQGQVDNVSIFWPSMYKSLQTALRVIYSHLHQ